MSQQPHVVVLGAGLAGIAALKKLQRAPFRITIVDKKDYHAFLPLLYQVASNELGPEHVASPIEGLIDTSTSTTFLQGCVSSIDLDRRQIMIEAQEQPLTYDYLMVALGALVNYFGVVGAKEYSLPLYTLDDAVMVKKRLTECVERARQDPKLIDDGVLNFCVVGGGATGVETAGAVTDLLHREFRRLELIRSGTTWQGPGRVHIVERGPSLLSPFKPILQQYARDALERRGVVVHLDDAVTQVTATTVTLRSGSVLRAHTVIWSAGLQGHPLPRTMGLPLEEGRPVTHPDLSISNYPEVFLAGDMARHKDYKDSTYLPQLGSVAQQAGQRAAENIALLVAGKATEPFKYSDRGTMAMIGRGDAIVQFRTGRTLTGRPAWAAWRAVHLMLLAGGEQQARTALEWGRARIGRSKRTS